MHQQQTAFENIVGKEIALYKQFLLFPLCFLLNQIVQRHTIHTLYLCLWIVEPHLSVFWITYFHILLNWKCKTLVYEVKG